MTPIEDAIRIQIRKNPDKSGLCPDHKMQCPDGTTCCKLYDGGYGCCPYPEGVCCKDGAHCCPHATQCDIQHGRCIRSHFLPMLMGLPEFNDIDPPMEKVSLFFMSYLVICFYVSDLCICVLILYNCWLFVLWQYWLWSFQGRNTKLERFLAENLHT